MTAIKYDLSGQDPDESVKVATRESPQPGMYVCTILELNQKEAKSGAGPQLEVVLEVTDADKAKNKVFAGSRLWSYVMLPGHDSWDVTAWKLDQLLQALGVASKRKRKGAFDPDKHVGEEVLVQVRAGKNQNNEYRGEVGAILQYDEDAWESGDDEDDEDEEYSEDTEYEDEDEADEDEDPRQSMTLAALRKEARELGVAVKGLDRDELIEAIEEAESESDEDEDDEPVDDEDDSDDDDDEDEEEDDEPAPKPRARRKPAAKSTTRKSPAKRAPAKRRTAAKKRDGFPFED